MNWTSVNFAWDKISEKEGLRGKKEVLIDYVVPLMDNLKDRDLIEMWNHSFQKPGEELDSRRIFVLLSSNVENTELSQAVRTYCSEKGLEEGRDFSINEEFYPSAMADFWGDNLETFARLKALSSTLAIEAMKENLGKNYRWHKNQNRPGHIWSNQLGCNYMEESQIYQSLAKGYLNHVVNQLAKSNFRDKLDRIKQRMEQSLEDINELKAG